MHAPSARVLVLDHDPDTLLTLQHELQDVGIDVTITWDEAEGYQLLETERYDLILIEDHPSDIDAASILDDVRLRGTLPAALILRETISKEEVEAFLKLGATGVMPKKNAHAVLEEVKKSIGVDAIIPKKNGLVEGQSLQAASSSGRHCASQMLRRSRSLASGVNHNVVR